jgi:cation transport ATPase
LQRPFFSLPYSNGIAGGQAGDQNKAAVTKGQAMNFNRFRRFDPLIDLAFWMFVVGFTMMLVMRFVPSLPPGLAYSMKLIIYFAGYAAWFLTVFLICARFMRDEYAEGLWQKSATMFSYILVLLPAIAIVAAYLYQAYTSPAISIPTPAERAALAAYPRPISWQISGALTLLLYIAAYVPFLFIALYKFNRWRDAR